MDASKPIPRTKPFAETWAITIAPRKLTDLPTLAINRGYLANPPTCSTPRACRPRIRIRVTTQGQNIRNEQGRFEGAKNAGTDQPGQNERSGLIPNGTLARPTICSELRALPNTTCPTKASRPIFRYIGAHKATKLRHAAAQTRHQPTLSLGTYEDSSPRGIKPIPALNK